MTNTNAMEHQWTDYAKKKLEAAGVPLFPDTQEYHRMPDKDYMWHDKQLEDSYRAAWNFSVGYCTRPAKEGLERVVEEFMLLSFHDENTCNEAAIHAIVKGDKARVSYDQHGVPRLPLPFKARTAYDAKTVVDAVLNAYLLTRYASEAPSRKPEPMLQRPPQPKRQQMRMTLF